MFAFCIRWRNHPLQPFTPHPHNSLAMVHQHLVPKQASPLGKIQVVERPPQQMTWTSIPGSQSPDIIHSGLFVRDYYSTGFFVELQTFLSSHLSSSHIFSNPPPIFTPRTYLWPNTFNRQSTQSTPTLQYPDFTARLQHNQSTRKSNIPTSWLLLTRKSKFQHPDSMTIRQAIDCYSVQKINRICIYSLV